MPAARLETTCVTPLPLPGALAERAPSRDLSRDPRSKAFHREPTYYAGPENSLVAAAVSRLIAAAERGASIAIPLTLIGPPGCGKSLLATGVAAAWVKAGGEEAVLSLTAVDLRRRLERAISEDRERPGHVGELVDRIASSKLLVIEDLEGLAESPVTVELLASLIDRLQSSRGVLLVTAGRPLGEIAGLDARVVGRLAAGLTLEVAAPGAAAREELLVASLAAAGRQIDTLAANDLAAWLPADARRVLSVAEQLQARFGGRKPIKRSEARAFVADAASNNATTPLSDIAAVTARYYAMPLRTLRSSSRKAPVVLGRAVAIYLARQLTPLSYEEIGRYFGGRDHTTVMHNYNRINDRMPKDRALRSAIDDLLRKLGHAELISKPRGEARP